MTVSLGGLVLADDLVLDPQGAGVGYNQRRLIGGASCVQVDGAVGGQALVLGSEWAYWTLAQVEQIRSMQSLGQSVELIHHRGTYQVLIIDTTGLVAEFDYADPDPDDGYTGTITMIEV